jgi:hypothetical protein
VVDVYYATRKVILKDESVKMRIVKVGSDIHNRNSMRVGDEVTIDTFQRKHYVHPNISRRKVK